MYVVKIQNIGGDYFLRGTIWAFAIERAQKFPSAEAARNALAGAARYTKKAALKTAQIVEVAP